MDDDVSDFISQAKAAIVRLLSDIRNQETSRVSQLFDQFAATICHKNISHFYQIYKSDYVNLAKGNLCCREVISITSRYAKYLKLDMADSEINNTSPLFRRVALLVRDLVDHVTITETVPAQTLTDLLRRRCAPRTWQRLGHEAQGRQRRTDGKVRGGQSQDYNRG